MKIWLALETDGVEVDYEGYERQLFNGHSTDPVTFPPIRTPGDFNINTLALYDAPKHGRRLTKKPHPIIPAIRGVPGVTPQVVHITIEHERAVETHLEIEHDYATMFLIGLVVGVVLGWVLL